MFSNSRHAPGPFTHILHFGKRCRLEEIVEHTSTGSHEDAKPPPLVCPRSARCPLENDLVVHGQFASFRVLRGSSLCNERVERSGGKHLGRGHGEVQGHHWGAVPFVEGDARDLGVGV